MAMELYSVKEAKFEASRNGLHYAVLFVEFLDGGLSDPIPVPAVRDEANESQWHCIIGEHSGKVFVYHRDDHAV